MKRMGVSDLIFRNWFCRVGEGFRNLHPSDSDAGDLWTLDKAKLRKWVKDSVKKGRWLRKGTHPQPQMSRALLDETGNKTHSNGSASRTLCSTSLSLHFARDNWCFSSLCEVCSKYSFKASPWPFLLPAKLLLQILPWWDFPGLRAQKLWELAFRTLSREQNCPACIVSVPRNLNQEQPSQATVWFAQV